MAALGGARLAKPQTIKLFTTVQDSNFSSRALGWDTPKAQLVRALPDAPCVRPHRIHRHVASWIAPQYDLYIILLTNRVNPTRATARSLPCAPRYRDARHARPSPEVVKAIEARASATPQTMRP